MRRRLPTLLVIVVVICSGLVLAARTTAAAQDQARLAADRAAYVGDRACADCHKPQHDAWSSTKHATALSKLGLSERSNGQCIRCHVTGSAEMIAAERGNPSRPNVQCEACHGPGRAHVDAARAGQAASVKTAPIAEQTCTRCHNETSPHYRPFFFTAMKGLVHQVR